MPEFIPKAKQVKGLDEFTAAYLECAEWAGGIEDEPEYVKADEIEWAPEAVERAIHECAAFQYQNVAALAAYSEPRSLAHAGHDFFLTRNGHGTGFWDRDDVPEWARKALTAAAKATGEVNVYFGDDGKLYLE